MTSPMLQGELALSRMPAGSVQVSTSEEAAAMQTPLKLGKMRYAVLLFVAASVPGITADELAQAFDVPHNSVAPRLTELASMGYIERTTLRRKTRSGGTAFVFTISPAGRRFLDHVKP